MPSTPVPEQPAPALAATACEQLADFARRASREVPEEARHEAARILLSGLRATLAATVEPTGTAMVRSELDRLGGHEGGSTVLWRQTRLPAEEAAACNAYGWSVLLLDDVEPVSGIHPGAPAASAALAIAESQGSCGRDLLAAIAASVEIQTVVARALAPEVLLDRGFAPLSVVAPLGAAVGGIALSDLDRRRSAHALGMAAMSGIGMWEMGGTASAVTLVASAIKLGLRAIRAAQIGIDAPPRALEGEAGAFRAYCGKDPAILMAAIEDLGTVWRIGELWYAAFSGDTYSQAPLEAVARLRRRAERAEPPSDLARILVGVHERVRVGVARKHGRYPVLSLPLQLNSDPQARVAGAWLRDIRSYGPGFEDLLHDAEVMSLRDRVEFLTDANCPDMRCAAVTLEFVNGETWTSHVAAYTGSAGTLSDDELSSWFVATGEPLLGKTRAQQVVEAVWDLDQASSLDQLAVALSVRPKEE